MFLENRKGAFVDTVIMESIILPFGLVALFILIFLIVYICFIIRNSIIKFCFKNLNIDINCFPENSALLEIRKEISEKFYDNIKLTVHRIGNFYGDKNGSKIICGDIYWSRIHKSMLGHKFYTKWFIILVTSNETISYKKNTTLIPIPKKELFYVLKIFLSFFFLNKIYGRNEQLVV